MASWLQANLGNIIVSVLLIALVAFVIFIMVRDKKKGKNSCAHGCASCAMHGECHKRAEEFKRKKAAGEL